MAVNKVEINTENGKESLIDLTGDTVTPDTLADGVVAHDAAGNEIIGRMSGGGGLSVQVDWNQNDPTQPDYVKNRTHYTETAEDEVLPLTEAMLMDIDGDDVGDLFIVLNSVSFIPGDNYLVNWNGTDYLTKCDAIPDGAPAIGDLFIASGGEFGAESTGEPFVITTMPMEDDGDPILAIMPIDGSEAVTLSITHIKENIQKIDPKFIPWEAAWQGSPLVITVDKTLDTATANLPFDVVAQMSVAQLKSITSFVFPEINALSHEVAVTSVMKESGELNGELVTIIYFLIPYAESYLDALIEYRGYRWISNLPEQLDKVHFSLDSGYTYVLRFAQ